MAVVQAGVSGPLWGTTDESYLFVHSLEATATAEKSELKNAQNEIVQAVWSSQKQTGVMRGRVRTTTGLPGASLVGHIVTIADTEVTALADGDWYIDEVTHSKQNDNWMEFTANVSSYPDPATGSFTTTT